MRPVVYTFMIIINDSLVKKSRLCSSYSTESHGSHHSKVMSWPTLPFMPPTNRMYLLVPWNVTSVILASIDSGNGLLPDIVSVLQQGHCA